MSDFEEGLLERLTRIAQALEIISEAVDMEKRTLRMEDVERAKVYATHLGKELKTP